jgi:copper(I)-binding protein
MGSDATSPGMMTMQPVDRIEVPAGETVSLEPGGYHIMLLALADPLEVGATVELTLTFEVAGAQVVRAEVRDTEP